MHNSRLANNSFSLFLDFLVKVNSCIITHHFFTVLWPSSRRNFFTGNTEILCALTYIYDQGRWLYHTINNLCRVMVNPLLPCRRPSKIRTYIFTEVDTLLTLKPATLTSVIDNTNLLSRKQILWATLIQWTIDNVTLAIRDYSLLYFVAICYMTVFI